jgi:hypothetical protein
METGCTTIELPDEGTANAILSMISGLRPVDYDEESDSYRVGYDD